MAVSSAQPAFSGESGCLSFLESIENAEIYFLEKFFISSSKNSSAFFCFSLLSPRAKGCGVKLDFDLEGDVACLPGLEEDISVAPASCLAMASEASSEVGSPCM